MEVQYNIISSETMRAAQADPDSYRDLVVRIAGYSAYFNELSRDCQDDLISRTENSL
jgi:formate C-acetyltransferase